MKKLLLALKAEIFSAEILPDFMVAFKALVKTNMSADALRSLSLYITYSLHKHSPARPLKVKRSNVQLKRQETLDVGNASPRLGEFKNDRLAKQQIGIMVLKMYSELLCDDDPSSVNIKKFARTVTNKVSSTFSFLFFFDNRSISDYTTFSGYCISLLRTIQLLWF